MLRGREPGWRSIELCGFGGGMRERDEEAAEESLHTLHYKVKVAL
jgi:hypothetical protein